MTIKGARPRRLSGRRLLFFLSILFPGLCFAQEKGTSVSFTNQIAPILLQKCLTCHGPEKSKGGYRLHTFESLIKGGESKTPAITPGEPAKSKLFELITAQDEDDRMPQKDDPLPAAQIELIARWIKDGARFDGSDRNALLVTLVPPPQQPDPPEVYPHPVPILALAFSPDGTELAVGGYHEITIWSWADGKIRRRIKNVAQRMHSLVYSRNGAILAAAGGTPGRGGEIKLFNAADGSLLKHLGTASDTMLSVCFSPDEKRLAASGADNAIRLYDVASGKQELLIEQHADWVMGLAFNSNGQQIASASRDKTARIFDCKTGELESTYVGHTEPVFTVAFSPDGQRVYSAGRDKKIHVWEAKDAKKIGEMPGCEDEIFRIIATGKFIFSCSADKQVRQYAADKRELLRTFSGHRDFVYSLAYHDPTARLASGCYDGEIRVWKSESGEMIASFQASPGH